MQNGLFIQYIFKIITYSEDLGIMCNNLFIILNDLILWSFLEYIGQVVAVIYLNAHLSLISIGNVKGSSWYNPMISDIQALVFNTVHALKYISNELAQTKIIHILWIVVHASCSEYDVERCMMPITAFRHMLGIRDNLAYFPLYSINDQQINDYCK